MIGTARLCINSICSCRIISYAEDPQFTIDVEMPTGTSLQETDRVVKEIAAWAKKQPGVEEVSSASGGAAPQLFNSMGAGSGQENGQIAVQGEEGKLDIDKTIADWDKHFKEDISRNLSCNINLCQLVSMLVIRFPFV